MAQDPRGYTSFSVKACPKNENQRIIAAEQKEEFFSSLGKYGDIEVLNRFGGGKIASGMRDLSKISDAIRLGETDSAIIPNSSGYIFETLGINTNAAEKAGEFNPGVLNRATGQAESILESVKGGELNLSNAASQIGEIQNLNTLMDGVFTEESKPAEMRELCDASPYAVDLMSYAPKHKFMFVVDITMAREYAPNLGSAGKVLSFLVKTSTRPNVSIEHEEINMYNFWVKIPKRTTHEPITMKFIDDHNSYAHDFCKTYLRSISPITRTNGRNQTGGMSVDWLQANSMNSSRGQGGSTASIGALAGNNKSIITEIKLYHLIDYGRKMTVYKFHHPKITNITLDELDMSEGGSGNEIELQFVYDALHVSDTQKLTDEITALTGGHVGSLYPIVPNPASVPDPNGQVEDSDQYEDEDDCEFGEDNGFGCDVPDDDITDSSESLNPIDYEPPDSTNVRQLDRSGFDGDDVTVTESGSFFGSGSRTVTQESTFTSQEFNYDDDGNLI